MLSNVATAITLLASAGLVHSYDPEFFLKVVDAETNETLGSINACHVQAGINAPCFQAGISTAAYSLDQVTGANTLGQDYIKPGNLTYTLGPQKIKQPFGLSTTFGFDNVLTGRFPNIKPDDIASITFATGDDQLARVVNGVPSSRWALCPFDYGTGTNYTVLSWVSGAGAIGNPDCKAAKVIRTDAVTPA